MSLATVLPIIAGAALALAALLLLFALYWFRRSRNDVFWRKRRDAGRRGLQAGVLAVILFVAGALTCVASGVIMLVDDDDSPAIPGETVQVDASPELVQSPTAQETPRPPETVVVVVTATPVHTPTDTPFPTFTPDVPPVESSVLPRPDAVLRVTALDDQISDLFTPVNPRTIFDAGITRIYLFVEFLGMEEGLLWKRQLYHEDTLVDGGAYLWGLENAGTTYFFFGDDGGFEAGRYEIRLYLGDDPNPISVTPFTIS